MKIKKIISVLCAAMLITSVIASCSKDKTDDFNTDGTSVSVADGTQDGTQSGGDSQTSEGTKGQEVVVYDPAAQYAELPVVDTQITKSPASVSTTYFTVDEQYIYFIDNQDEGIYKVASDGSGDMVKLSDAKVSTVDITSDGKLAYTTNMEADMDSNSFTMNKDGSNVVDNKELILDFAGPTEFKGSDGKIYASLGMNEGFDESGIYVRNEGDDVSAATLIKAGFIDSFCLVDDFIVCSITGTEGTSIYRCALDGSSMVKVINADASKLCVAGDKIYFINRTDDNFVYEMTIDAVKKAK